MTNPRRRRYFFKATTRDRELQQEARVGRPACRAAKFPLRSNLGATWRRRRWRPWWEVPFRGRLSNFCRLLQDSCRAAPSSCTGHQVPISHIQTAPNNSMAFGSNLIMPPKFLLGCLPRKQRFRISTSAPEVHVDHAHLSLQLGIERPAGRCLWSRRPISTLAGLEAHLLAGFEALK